jgi:hypothetical protein
MWLNNLIRRIVVGPDGVALPERHNWKFQGKFSVADDQPNDQSIVTIGQGVQLHDLTHNPAVLWQFNETLNDTSGNARHLSMTAGNLRYTEIYPGVRALNVGTANRFQFATTGTALQHTGDITILCLLLLYATADGVLLTYDGNSEAEANNTLYEVSITTEQLHWKQESGAGVDALFGSARLPPVGELCHLVSRRQAGVIQNFTDGLPIGAASSLLTTPTGGTTSFIRIGSAATAPPACALASMKVVLSALSDADIKAEFNRTLGGLYGQLT